MVNTACPRPRVLICFSLRILLTLPKDSVMAVETDSFVHAGEDIQLGIGKFLFEQSWPKKSASGKNRANNLRKATVVIMEKASVS